MIEVVVWKAKDNAIFQNNGTFVEGELYFGRLSKDGNAYVIRSEEGYWIPIERYTWAKRTKKTEYFERQCTIYMRNRKRLNEFVSVEQYADNKDNYRQWSKYYPMFDKELTCK